MGRYVFGLLLPLLAACAGKNTVAGEDKTKAQQLQESVPSWCGHVCERIVNCSKSQDCVCNGDACHCPSASDTCEQSCEQMLNGFAQDSETCANVGLNFERCIDAVSCEKLFEEDTCMPTSKADKACFPDQESNDPPSQVGDNSSAGAGPIDQGSSSGGASAAGGASGGGSSASGGASGDPDAMTTCSTSFGSGAAPGNTSNEICEGGALDCKDGHEYRYLCSRTSDGRSACSCFIDDQVTGAFDPGGVCPTPLAVNGGCGWNVTGF